MVLVCRERGPPFQQSLNHHTGRIQDREPPDETDKGRTIGSARRIGKHDGAKAKIKSEELTPRIPHEDARRIRIEPEKTQEPSQDRNHHAHHDPVAGHIGKKGHPSETQQRQSSCQSIQPIGKVQSIGDSDKQKKSHRHSNPQWQLCLPHKRQRREVHPTDPDDNGSGDQLSQELRFITESDSIVPGAEQ